MKARRGFTLLELIIVIATMGIASTMGMVVFSQINTIWHDQTSKTALNNNATTAFNACAEDILGMQAAGVQFVGIPKSDGKAAPTKADLANQLPDDQLRITKAPTGAPAVDIVYQIEHRDGTNVLTRAESPTGAQAGSARKIAENVAGMYIEFTAKGPGSPWQRGWSKAEMPGAVRINLLMADPAQPQNLTVRKMVFPIVVN